MVVLLCEDRGSLSHVYFLIRIFLQTQSLETLRMCNCGLPMVVLLCEDRGSLSHLYFLIRTFLQTQSRELKIILISPKRRSSVRPIEFFSVTLGFQRSSYCVKTLKVRHWVYFLVINAAQTQFFIIY